MRACVQRVSEAHVTVDGAETGRIGRGLVVLLGVGHNDGEAEVNWLAEKIVGLRVFEDAAGKMNLSLAEVGGRDAGDQPVHAVWRLPPRASAELYGCGAAGVGGAAL